VERDNLHQEAPYIPLPQPTSSLHRVTPLSKCLAMALFIILPFIGGYIGYTFAPVKVVEVERVVVNEVEKEEVCEVTSMSNSLSADEYHANLETLTGIEFESSESAIRYAMLGDTITSEDSLAILNDVTISDQIIEVKDLPYLSVVASTSEKLFLTRSCFANKGCLYHNLYVFDNTDRTLDEMEISQFYDTLNFGSQLSLDGKYVATVVPHYEYDERSLQGSSLMVLDLLNDSAQVLDYLDVGSTKSFCIPSMGCDLRVNWMSDGKIEVSISDENYQIKTRQYNFDKEN
jgi:hypothetical protein